MNLAIQLKNMLQSLHASFLKGHALHSIMGSLANFLGQSPLPPTIIIKWIQPLSIPSSFTMTTLPLLLPLGTDMMKMSMPRIMSLLMLICQRSLLSMLATLMNFSVVSMMASTPPSSNFRLSQLLSSPYGQRLIFLKIHKTSPIRSLLPIMLSSPCARSSNPFHRPPHLMSPQFPCWLRSLLPP